VAVVKQDMASLTSVTRGLSGMVEPLTGNARIDAMFVVVHAAIRSEQDVIEDFRVEFVNQAACDSHGTSREQLIGRRLSGLPWLFPPAGLFNELCQVVETGAPWHQEDWKDGEGRVLEVHASKLDDGVMVSWRDAADRTRPRPEPRDRARPLLGRGKAEHMNRVLRSIRNVNQLIVREADPEALVQQACLLLVEHCGYDGAWMALAGSDGSGSIMAEAGLDAVFEPFAERLRQGRWPDCFLDCWRAEDGYSACEPRRTCSGCPLFFDVGGNRSACVLLRRGGDLFGMMAVSVPPEIPMDGDERSLLVEIAHDIAFALHDIETADQRHKAEQSLRASEANLKRAQRVARIGHWQLDSHDGAPVWSEQMFRIFGLDPIEREPAFADHDALMPPEDFALVDAAMRGGFRDGTPFDLVFRIRRKNGEIGWMHALGQPEIDEHGKTAKMFGTAQDITELKRTEDDLRLEKERAQRYLDIASVMLVGLDADGKVNLINRRGCQVLGFEQEGDALGQDWFEFVPVNERSKLRESVKAIMEREVVAHEGVESRIRTVSGEERRIVWHHAEVRDAEGRITGTLSSGQDVTERLEMEAQLAQADRLSSMGMLAAGVAHEINNPLAYILYNLESLTEDLPTLLQPMRRVHEEAEERGDSEGALASAAAAMNPALLDDILERFDDALEGTRRIRDIARGLGMFSRVERDKLVPVNLQEVIEVAVNMGYNEIKYRAHLVKEYNQVPPVMASEGRLSQVFLNLIINATHAIDEGGVEENELRIRTWRDGDTVCAQVRDSGCGVPHENLGRLFEPFFSTKPTGAGSGLGLAISKNIVESFGGTIEVESEVGRGTSVTIRLPSAAAKTEAALVSAEGKRAAGPHGRVLIVDDDRGMRLAMARMLRDHETVLVASGAEARSLLEKDQSFDAVLCDVMMPSVSGVEIHRWLAVNHPSLAERLIFTTGGAFTPRTREYLSVVDNVRLEKPFDPAAVQTVIGDLVRSARGATSVSHADTSLPVDR
jgi:PAS domain S-box-containing protein